MNEDFAKQLDCMRPHSPCWCEQHPNSNHPKCITAVSINCYTWILMIIAIIFAFKIIQTSINSLTK